MRKELRKRLASEYRYAVTKMNEDTQPAKKMFYFSVFFSEAQRSTNWEWDSSLSLMHVVVQHAHTQITNAMNNAAIGQIVPTDWKTVHDRLASVANDLAAYFERAEDEDKELFSILCRLMEVSYAVSGHGSYLHEKGTFKF